VTDDLQPSMAPDPDRPVGGRSLPPAPPLPPPTRREPSSADIRPRRPEYRGEELDPERGPGLGCFWFQVIVLAFFVVIIPVGLNLNWPFEVLAVLLFIVIGLLLLTGQTVIFLLRLVAADRRAAGRRRPLAGTTKTVGELEDELAEPDAAPSAAADAPAEPDADASPDADDAAAADDAAPADRPDSESLIREVAPPSTAHADAGSPEADPESGIREADRGATHD
jgi:hypothetical protein